MHPRSPFGKRCRLRPRTLVEGRDSRDVLVSHRGYPRGTGKEGGRDLGKGTGVFCGSFQSSVSTHRVRFLTSLPRDPRGTRGTLSPVVLLVCDWSQRLTSQDAGRLSRSPGSRHERDQGLDPGFGSRDLLPRPHSPLVGSGGLDAVDAVDPPRGEGPTTPVIRALGPLQPPDRGSVPSLVSGPLRSDTCSEPPRLSGTPTVPPRVGPRSRTLHTTLESLRLQHPTEKTTTRAKSPFPGNLTSGRQDARNHPGPSEVSSSAPRLVRVGSHSEKGDVGVRS